MAYEYITRYDSPNYSRGRPAGPPAFIVIHWWDDPAKKPQFQQVVNYLCRKGGNSSAHYVAEAGRVACIVDPDDRAWHAGSLGNPRGIGIECNPRMSSGDKETVAELIARLRATYGALPLHPHSEYMATSCPGTWKGQLGWLDKRARELAGDSGGKPAPAPKPEPKPEPGGDLDDLARAVIRGDYGNGDERRRRLGSRYAEVQKRVNDMLASSPIRQPTTDELARAVIRGTYGNGEERKRKLGSRYAEVQKRVNEMLK